MLKKLIETFVKVLIAYHLILAASHTMEISIILTERVCKMIKKNVATVTQNLPIRG